MRSSTSYLHPYSTEHQWPPSTGVGTSHWLGGPTHPTAYRHQLLNPSPSSIGMQPPHIRQHQQQQQASWVTEMEQRRVMEHMALMQQEKERQKYQQQQQAAQRVIYKLVVSLCYYIYSLAVLLQLDSFLHQLSDKCTARQWRTCKQYETE